LYYDRGQNIISGMKPTVYVETTIPSYLTAWPSRDLVRAAEQQVTRVWWNRRNEYELFVSELVWEECRAGDPDAATARLVVLTGLPLLEQGPDVAALADLLVRNVSLPPNAVADATHIALAAIHGIELLVTWNCRHIANPILRPRVEAICRAAGYEPPSICTPAELLGGADDEGA
jgi:predicted nucleic acid-binding protein